MKTRNFLSFHVCIPVIEYEKLIQQRQLLDGQLNENKNVLDELNLLKESNQVRPSFFTFLLSQ